MAFYKLYKKLHRRTDTWDLMIMIDHWMRPEYHKKRREEARAALARFMAAGAVISSVGGYDFMS